MRPVILFTLSLLFALTVGSAFGQLGVALRDPQPMYRNFSASHGLPSSETYYVHQDKQGFIWICTDRGVARYDGYRFRVFTKKDGLPDNVIFRIYEDHLGRMWFISYNSMLCYYKEGKFHAFRHNDLIRRKTIGQHLPGKHLVVRKDGTICYSLHAQGYMLFYPDGRADLSHFGNVPRGREKMVFHHENGEHWIELRSSVEANISGLPVKLRMLLSEKNRTVNMHSPSLTYVITETILNGQLFVRGSKKVLLRRGNTFVYDARLGADVITMCQSNGQLWIGNAGKGIACYDVPADGVPRKRMSLLSNYSVTHVLRDRDGGYWFSTLEDGVFYAPNMSIRHLTPDEGMPFQSVLRIAGYKNNIYAASGSSFFQQLNAPWRQELKGYLYPHYNMAVLGGRVFTPDSPLRENVKGTATGTSDGDMYQGKERVVFLTMAKVVRAYRDLSCDTFTLNVYRQRFSTRVNAVAEDGNGTIWYNVGQEIYRQGNSGSPEKLPFGREAYDMAWSEKWGLAVATKDDGIYFLREGKTWLHLTQKDGLPTDIITVVKIDEQERLWVGTNEGVSVVVMQRDKPRIVNLNTSRGLVSNEVNDFYFYSGKAWIATKKGVSIVDIDANLAETGFRPLLLTSVESPVRSTGSYREFGSGVSFIKVVFRTLDYRSSAIRQFRYRTQHDGGWVYTQTPEVLLTDPGSGDYVLEVSYRNVDGKWSPPTTLTRFTVLAPYYARWYFVVVQILLGALLVYLLSRIRIRQINRRNQLQKTINSLEQKALRAQMNPHFIFNSLNSIQSFLIYEENEKAEKYLLRFARLIRQTLNNSRESYIAIESEMETLRGYLELEQMRFKEKFTFEITCGLSAEELQWGVPPMLIQPFVENAVLHGFKTMESGGRIEVRFERLENQRLLCVVEDNGIGRRATMSAKPEGHKSFGTKITEERLAAFRQKYGDEFSIETIDKDENGQAAGTKIVMHIPVVGPGEFEETEES